MKKLVYIFIFASIFFTSCGGFEEIDGGFPKELTFPKEGGEMNLTGRVVYRLVAYMEWFWY